MVAQDMVKHQDQSTVSREETRAKGHMLIPAVDIFESDETLTLVADMPGVSKNGLDINLEKGVLTLNGAVEMKECGKPLLREFSSASYYRQFRLSEHIDAEKATAKLDNGVLTLSIPKAESAKPKRIEIRH